MAIRLLLTEFKINTILRFNRILKVTLGLLLLQLTLICFDYSIYVDLFLAPLLYLFVTKQMDPQKNSIKLQFLHLSFLMVLSWFSLFSTNDFYLVINAFYLLTYCFLIKNKLKVNLEKRRFYSGNLFVSFCTFYMGVVAVLLLVDFIDNNLVELILPNNRFIFAGMLVSMICFTFFLLYREQKTQFNIDEPHAVRLQEEEDKKNVMQVPNRVEIVAKIKSFFEESDLYLQANFTLEDLSAMIDVPRSVLSDVMNKEMESGFYSILGEYRINYAKLLLLKKDNFTIEALVYQCGFHSKSTFNKYFKQFVGQTPSSFRNEHLPNIRSL